MDYQRSNNKRSDAGRTITMLFGIVSLLVIAALAVGIVFKGRYDKAITTPYSDSKEQVRFEVVSGASADQIADGLIESKLLKEENKVYFKLYLRQSGLGSTIQAGKYKLTQSMNMKEIVETLQTAVVTDIWITIPEGLRADEIGDIIETAYSGYGDAVFSGDRFLELTEDSEFISTLDLSFLDNADISNLEGLLFPDTYNLPIEATEEYVIITMVNTFNSKIGESVTYDQLILSSLIEKEARTETDRKMVSDIMIRRLEEGWTLGLDVALLYYHKDWKYELNYDDLQADNPYNLRIHTGLTPTPICNPGFSSIKAALHPQENEYYFFIADNDGLMHYAVTLAEHNSQIEQYLR